MNTANTMDVADQFIDTIFQKAGVEIEHDHPQIDSRNKTLLIKNNNEFFLNDLNFMPVYEIKSLKQPSENNTFDIFQDELGDSKKYKRNSWDSSMAIDYKKL